MKMETPRISTVILNWNRAPLLERTIESYLQTVSVPFELFVVDNASTDDSRRVIEATQAKDPRVTGIFLRRNLGGPAFNSGLRRARAPFLHTSENDIEYLPGWDQELLGKFDAFPTLGQLSPFGPIPEQSRGEFWDRPMGTEVTMNGQTIFVTDLNITSTAICRRELWDQGFRWSSIPKVPGQPFKLPNDFAASDFVRQLGLLVAWNDKYTVVNWGHNVEEWKRDLDYYLADARAKPWMGVDGLRERLRSRGYDLVTENGQSRIVPSTSSSQNDLGETAARDLPP